MSKQDDELRRTSRRAFTKTLTTAMLATPALVSLAEASPIASSLQKPKQKVAPEHGTEEAEKEHNTPPPIVIMDGSLIVERRGEYQASEVVTQGNRKYHKMNADSSFTKLFPQHIKVVDGSGEILYRNDVATECVVTLALVDPNHTTSRAVVNAFASPIVDNRRSFVIDTDMTGNKLLRKTNEKPTSTKRTTRYRHMDNGNNEFSILDLKITRGADVLFSVALADLPEGGAELKILIWLEQS